MKNTDYEVGMYYEMGNKVVRLLHFGNIFAIVCIDGGQPIETTLDKLELPF